MPTLRELYFRHLGLPSSSPMAIEADHAENIYVFDRHGKRYTDLVSGVSVSNVGHRHPAVLDAIRRQLDRYMHLMVYGEYVQAPQVELAEALTSVLPSGLDAVFFVNSGSEAVEGALKLAKRFTGRYEVISFKNAYHGGTAGALSILGHERLKQAFRPLVPGIRMLDYNKPEQLDAITGDTACVIVECIQAEAGIIVPDKEFMRQLRRKCDESGSLLVIDDIQMGFGRTAKLFSFEHSGITPDILCLAKGMGGGMPIGAFVSSRDIMDTLTFKPELGHITTFGGHPVSAAAALANLNVILGQDLVAAAETRGSQFEDQLQGHPAIKDMRRAGLMIGVELESSEAADRLTALFLEAGLVTDRFLFRPSAFRIAPPLVITEEQVSETGESIRKCLDNL